MFFSFLIKVKSYIKFLNKKKGEFFCEIVYFYTFFSHYYENISMSNLSWGMR